ncbi:hypothetical protein RJ640_012061 [Escallonia rubra]|uniref:F-box domain-containing protein n=1 Tax=Escallonia rubra TaxID=112253 RepID=A0AA88USD2_9ASTE|nr:hypothetical protein RJ640_012061 [Escallonia rubra]
MSLLLMSWFKIFRIANFMPSMKKSASPKVQRLEEKEEASLLDLPDLALECILERLSPAGLSSMAGACSSLRDWCRSDHLWGKHMKQKWGKLTGDAAYRKWQIEVDLRKRKTMLECSKEKGLCGLVSKLLPFSSDRLKVDGNGEQSSYSLPADSIMAWYLSLEGGKFLFPAQVYNRENGNVGYMLSCYDAELSYDSATDTFKARYSSHGRPTVEDNIEWSRLRAPAVDTPAHK